MDVGWGLVPRAICIYSVVLVSPGYDTANYVLTPSVREPAVEPLMSDKATVVTDPPKGAVFSQVIGVG